MGIAERQHAVGDDGGLGRAELEAEEGRRLRVEERALGEGAGTGDSGQSVKSSGRAEAQHRPA